MGSRERGKEGRVAGRKEKSHRSSNNYTAVSLIKTVALLCTILPNSILVYTLWFV